MSKQVKTHLSKTPKKTTLLIQLDDDLKKKYQKVCKDLDLSVSASLRHFIRLSVDRYEREKRENNLVIKKNAQK